MLIFLSTYSLKSSLKSKTNPKYFWLAASYTLAPLNTNEEILKRVGKVAGNSSIIFANTYFVEDLFTASSENMSFRQAKSKFICPQVEKFEQ